MVLRLSFKNYVSETFYTKDVRNFVNFFWNVRKANIYKISQSFCECEMQNLKFRIRIRMQIFDISPKLYKILQNVMKLYTIIHNYTHCYEILLIDAKCKKLKFRSSHLHVKVICIYEFAKKSSFAHPCSIILNMLLFSTERHLERVHGEEHVHLPSRAQHANHWWHFLLHIQVYAQVQQHFHIRVS